MAPFGLVGPFLLLSPSDPSDLSDPWAPRGRAGPLDLECPGCPAGLADLVGLGIPADPVGPDNLAVPVDLVCPVGLADHRRDGPVADMVVGGIRHLRLLHNTDYRTFLFSDYDKFYLFIILTNS